MAPERSSDLIVGRKGVADHVSTLREIAGCSTE
jgi:hypothetical protein